MKKTLTTVLTIAGLFLLVAFFSWQFSFAKVAERSAVSGGDYLLRVLQEDGSFIYEADALTGKSLGGYNMLRHAGTTYSMLELYGHTGDRDLLAGAEKALEFIKLNTQTCFGEAEDVRCVLDGKKVKLGGNALAILAYSKHAEVTGTDEYISEAESLADWILGTQSSAGEFLRHIELIDTGELYDHISEYYPGEAIFALVRLFEETGDEKYLGSAERGADWLINVRDKGKSPSDLPHDHWLLYGLNELYENAPSKMYVAHAKKIVGAIIESQHKDKAGILSKWNGGWYSNPRTTPAATRAEGLVAAHSLFNQAGETELLPEIERSIELALKFVLKHQMTSGKVREEGAHSGSLGGFVESEDKFDIRIDFVQHSISALLGYSEL